MIPDTLWVPPLVGVLASWLYIIGFLVGRKCGRNEAMDRAVGLRFNEALSRVEQLVDDLVAQGISPTTERDEAVVDGD